MNPVEKVKKWWQNDWKITVQEPCPANCNTCPAFSSVDVYNQERSGRVMRTRGYLAKNAIGYHEFAKGGFVTPLLKKLGEQAFALFDGDAVVDQACEGPRIEYPEGGSLEYECRGILHITSRAERLLGVNETPEQGLQDS